MTSNNYPITYLLESKYKKSTYSNEYWEKTFDDTTVKLIITTQWRWGEFNITVNTPEEDQLINNMIDNHILINNYDFEFIQTNDACCITHEIENLDKLPDKIKYKVIKDIYKDKDNNEIYEESILEEDKGWVLDDTIYEIYEGYNTTIDE